MGGGAGEGLRRLGWAWAWSALAHALLVAFCLAGGSRPGGLGPVVEFSLARGGGGGTLQVGRRQGAEPRGATGRDRQAAGEVAPERSPGPQGEAAASGAAGRQPVSGSGAGAGAGAERDAGRGTTGSAAGADAADAADAGREPAGGAGGAAAAGAAAAREVSATLSRLVGAWAPTRRAPSPRGTTESWATLHAHLQRRSAGCYPAVARRRGVEGEVVVSFHLDGAGHPQEVRVVESSGVRSLDEAAVRCVILGAAPLPGPAGALRIRIPFVLR